MLSVMSRVNRLKIPDWSLGSLVCELTIESGVTWGSLRAVAR